MKKLIIEYLVDDEDVDLLENVHPLLLISYNGETLPIHRVISCRMGIEAEVIDHINRNSQDNTRSNLRGATRTQNVHNSSRKKSNTSGYIGVDFYKPYLKWRARIRIDGKRKCLGYFDNPIDAAIEYDKESKKRGEFSVLNFHHA